MLACNPLRRNLYNWLECNVFTKKSDGCMKCFTDTTLFFNPNMEAGFPATVMTLLQIASHYTMPSIMNGLLQPRKHLSTQDAYILMKKWISCLWAGRE